MHDTRMKHTSETLNKIDILYMDHRNQDKLSCTTTIEDSNLRRALCPTAIRPLHILLSHANWMCVQWTNMPYMYVRLLLLRRNATCPSGSNGRVVAGVIDKNHINDSPIVGSRASLRMQIWIIFARVRVRM